MRPHHGYHYENFTKFSCGCLWKKLVIFGNSPRKKDSWKSVRALSFKWLLSYSFRGVDASRWFPFKQFAGGEVWWRHDKKLKLVAEMSLTIWYLMTSSNCQSIVKLQLHILTHCKPIFNVCKNQKIMSSSNFKWISLVKVVISEL